MWWNHRGHSTEGPEEFQIARPGLGDAPLNGQRRWLTACPPAQIELRAEDRVVPSRILGNVSLKTIAQHLPFEPDEQRQMGNDVTNNVGGAVLWKRQ